jgi:hypothetical protein
MLAPDSILAWLVIGATGWLAGVRVTGCGFGLIG